MGEKHRVPVFDPESKDLRRLPLKNINSPYSSIVFVNNYALTMNLGSEFDEVKLPRWRRRFDVYESSEDSKDLHAVITSPKESTEGMRLLARLYISRFGVASDVQRVLSSKHRSLYIGAMPDL